TLQPSTATTGPASAPRSIPAAPSAPSAHLPIDAAPSSALHRPVEPKAARWALPRLPEEHRAVLGRALAAYRGEAEDSRDDIRPQVRAYADHVVEHHPGVAGRFHDHGHVPGHLW